MYIIKFIAYIYSVLVIGRFLMALGSGVGLKMTFTLINECYAPDIASQKTSYLILAFAVTPGLGIALGGFLNSHYGWVSCFYASVMYGIILLLLVKRLPETQTLLDKYALNVKHLWRGYKVQFRNFPLVLGGLLMGGATCFVYIFAAAAPFVAINLSGLSSLQYGIANLIPSAGLICGSLGSAYLVKRQYTLNFIMKIGISIAVLGCLLMMTGTLLHWPVIFALFLSMAVIYVGLAGVISNASVLAMGQVKDKAHGSAVMNFMNMGCATLGVLSLRFFSMTALLLSVVFLLLSALLIGLYKLFSVSVNA